MILIINHIFNYIYMQTELKEFLYETYRYCRFVIVYALCIIDIEVNARITTIDIDLLFKHSETEVKLYNDLRNSYMFISLLLFILMTITILIK